MADYVISTYDKKSYHQATYIQSPPTYDKPPAACPPIATIQLYDLLPAAGGRLLQFGTGHGAVLGSTPKERKLQFKPQGSRGPRYGSPSLTLKSNLRDTVAHRNRDLELYYPHTALLTGAWGG